LEILLRGPSSLFEVVFALIFLQERKQSLFLMSQQKGTVRDPFRELGMEVIGQVFDEELRLRSIDSLFVHHSLFILILAERQEFGYGIYREVWFRLVCCQTVLLFIENGKKDSLLAHHG
jgi:hypothetical protein